MYLLKALIVKSFLWLLELPSIQGCHDTFILPVCLYVQVADTFTIVYWGYVYSALRMPGYLLLNSYLEINDAERIVWLKTWQQLLEVGHKRQFSLKKFLLKVHRHIKAQDGNRVHYTVYLLITELCWKPLTFLYPKWGLSSVTPMWLIAHSPCNIFM